MNSENNTIEHWPDPKDYGLPVVEIKPFRSDLPIPSSEVQREVILEKSIISAETVPNPIVQSIILAKSAESEAVKIPAPAVPQATVERSLPPRKESRSWVGIVAVLTLVILAVIIWQMTSEDKERFVPVAFDKEAVLSTTNAQEPISNVKDSKPDNSEDIENQVVETELKSSSNTAIEKSETGITIDNNIVGTLIRVESKAERPTYFIIVGSLPNERFALEEAPQYQNRVPTVYLITPYDDTKNYRLAIGSFRSFTKANEELERIKADYTEALWILKY